jgi:hypothetical protein
MMIGRPLELCLGHCQEIVDPQVNGLDLSRLDVAHQPVQLAKAVLIGRTIPCERDVIGDLTGRRTNNGEPTDHVSVGASARDAHTAVARPTRSIRRVTKVRDMQRASRRMLIVDDS